MMVEKLAGESASIILVLEDVELQVPEGCYQQLVEGLANQGLCLLDEQGRFVLWNRGAEQLLQFPRQAMLGTPCDRLFSTDSQDDAPVRGLLDRARSKGSAAYEGWLTRQDGSRLWGTAEVQLLTADSTQPARFALFLRDPGYHQEERETLRASEARYRAILETAVDGIITIDELGSISSFNPGAERMFGYSAEEVIGRNVSVLMPAPYAAAHDGYLAHYRATGEKRIIGIGREVTARHRDGHVFPIDLAVAEAWVGSRRIFTGVVRDITERKRSEEALRISNKNLEQALIDLQAKSEELRLISQQLWQTAKLATLGELAASVAHELNNPLATVSLRVESLLGQTGPEGPGRRALEVIDQEVERMSTLVAGLLQFSRRGHEQVSTVEVGSEMLRALDLVQYHLRQRRIEIIQEIDPTIPSLFADRQKLRQVLLNLLTNASDAMPDGGTLTLRVHPGQLEASRAVVIEVIDTGVGIPQEHLAKVVEPFFTTKEEGKGTGLGLAICRRVVQEHNGVLQIESQPGKGTLVRIILPVLRSTNVDHLRDRLSGARLLNEKEVAE